MNIAHGRDDHNLSLASRIASEATVEAVSPKIAAADLRTPASAANCAALEVLRHRFAKLVGER